MMPIAPPNSGPIERDIIKYAPPPSIAPFVDIADTESTVNITIKYDKVNITTASVTPACKSVLLHTQTNIHYTHNNIH